MSRWTVKRALNEANFTAIEKKKKPLLSERNIRQRKNFVQKYEHWSEEDWMKVVWSDESKINRYRTDGRSWSWKRQGESLQPRDYIQTIKHNGGNIKVWGCFSANGVGPIFKIDGIMDKNMYLSILKDKLAETIDFMPYPNNEVTFQHDNDPKHTAKIVQSWLKEQAQSPDLNPIENLWSYLKGMSQKKL